MDKETFGFLWMYAFGVLMVGTSVQEWERKRLLVFPYTRGNESPVNFYVTWACHMAGSVAWIMFATFFALRKMLS